MPAKMITISVFLLGLFMISCSSKMYQVLETTSQLKQTADGVVFENSELRVSYDLWGNGGKVRFFLYNKLGSPIYINWDKSHLVYNGVSYEYWHDSELTSSIYNATTSGSTIGSGNALLTLFSGTAYGTSSTSSTYRGKKVVTTATSKYKPKPIIQIPPKSSIIVSDFTISASPYFDCDFNVKSVSGRGPAIKSFTVENSPISFRNYLTYSTEPTLARDIVVDNEFYISKVSLMKEKDFLGNYKRVKLCDLYGEKNSLQYANPYRKSNSFFIEFRKK